MECSAVMRYTTFTPAIEGGQLSESHCADFATVYGRAATFRHVEYAERHVTWVGNHNTSVKLGFLPYRSNLNHTRAC